MPKIPSYKLEEFKKYLAAQKITYYFSRVPCKALTPIQIDLAWDKVKVNLLPDPELDERPIIVDHSHNILDGHHRFAARMLRNPDSLVLVLVIYKPLNQALQVARGFKYE
jgi:hypothetical protein